MNDIHIFLVKASAAEGNDFGYPKNERHALLVFINQEQGTDHNWEKAEKIINDSLWNSVDFLKAGTLTIESMKEKDQTFVNCYEGALLNGSAILVYSGIEKE